MPKVTVRQGDCVNSIALAHGFDPDLIWDHPGNAELKQLRRSPNALLPGDELELPPLELREDPVATGSVGRFKLSVGPVKLRLRLTNHGQPRADLPYELIFEGDGTLTGTTDGDGWIDQPIPAAATRATLSLDDGDEQYELMLGHLDPHDSSTGVQQRLRALGYYFGRVDADIATQTQNALRRFQEQHGLTVSGEIDDPTIDALHDAYGG
ncbi:MAG: peptidoglycan-binding domain-containing protein [Enhygromyxa sp.]